MYILNCCNLPSFANSSVTIEIISLNDCVFHYLTSCKSALRYSSHNDVFLGHLFSI